MGNIESTINCGVVGGGIVGNITQSTISGCNNVINNIGVGAETVNLLLRIIQQQCEMIDKQAETILQLREKYYNLLVTATERPALLKQ